MPLTAAASAREILTGLHDVMAKRGRAGQARQGGRPHRRGDGERGLLDLSAARQRARAVRHPRPQQGSGPRHPAGAWARAWSARSPRKGAILNLAEAASHPEFAYRPETGEELFHSFAGVPIIRTRAGDRRARRPACRSARATTRSRSRRCRPSRWCLSELIANARLADGAAPRRRSRDAGTAAARRPEAGRRHGQGRRRLSTSRASLIEHTVAEDTEAERRRVYAAFRRMREQIDAMTREAEFGTAGEHQEILETYKMFAYDEGWSRRINEAIDSGLTAEAAIERVQQRTRAAHARDRRSAARRSGCTTSTICRTGCCASSRAARHRGADRPAAGRDPDRPQPRARPNCSNMTGGG